MALSSMCFFFARRLLARSEVMYMDELLYESCVLGDRNALPAADCRNAAVMMDESPRWISLFRNV